MKLVAVIRTKETSTVEAEGSDYEAARAAVDAKIPEGYEVQSYRRAD